MALNKTALIELYGKRAKRYDVTANLYYLLGFREQAYRKRAVRALGLRPGDTVVEIGCGTGLNFPLLEEAVGSGGKVIGVDLTPEMLHQARGRVEREGWRNVTLIESDAAAYRFPSAVQGVLSTFALTLVPEFDRVIRQARRALTGDGRLVLLDFKMPEGWPPWILEFWLLVTRPFGVSLDLAERHPWECLAHCFPRSSLQRLYFGLAYISVGEVPAEKGLL